MILPNFFIVGAPKCGTTSMHAYLGAHPEIFMSRPKEPRFWCKDLHAEGDYFHSRRRYFEDGIGSGAIRNAFRRECEKLRHRPHKRFKYRSIRRYAGLFRSAAGFRVVGESSTDYFLSRCAAGEIAATIPDARIMIMLRDPTAYIHAAFLEALDGWIGEDEADFSTALALEPVRADWRRVPSSARFPSTLYYRQNARFSEAVGRFRDRFPPRRLRIVLLDDLRADPAGTYRGVLNFLGVDDRAFLPDLTPRNVSSRRFDAPPVEGELMARLRAEFRPEVARLSDMLGRDLLTLWGYME